MSGEIELYQQSITDSMGGLYGHEILCRPERSKNVNWGNVSRFALEKTFGKGIPETGLKKFVNGTRETLIHDCESIPPGAGLEILEDVRADEHTLQNAMQLKSKGVTIAVDDYTGQPWLRPFLAIADIVKIDIMRCNPIKTVRSALGINPDIVSLAEKVETAAHFMWLKKAGFQLFQGHYLSMPMHLQTR